MTFSTVFGASSSKSSIAMAPWFVCSVASLMSEEGIRERLDRACGRCELATLEPGHDAMQQVRGLVDLVRVENRADCGEVLPVAVQLHRDRGDVLRADVAVLGQPHADAHGAAVRQLHVWLEWAGAQRHGLVLPKARSEEQTSELQS